MSTNLNAQRNIGKTYMMSMEFELSSPTPGYGFGITPNISLGLNYFWLGIGGFGGSEAGYYEEGIYDEPSTRYFANNIQGDIITNHSFSNLKSGFNYGGKITSNFLIVFDSSTKTKENRNI